MGRKETRDNIVSSQNRFKKLVLFKKEKKRKKSVWLQNYIFTKKYCRMYV